MTNIYLKMATARVKLQSLNLKKSGENAYSKFKYFELGDFLPEVNEIFEELKIFSLFQLGQENADLVIVNAENPEEKITFSSPVAKAELKGCTDIQALGAAHTYLKRYLYLNAFEIVENDILDENAGKTENKAAPKETKSEKPLCPVCGKETTALAIKNWGCCAKCKAEQNKQKEKVNEI